MRIETIEHINALLPAFTSDVSAFQLMLIVNILRSKKGSELFKTVDIRVDKLSETKRLVQSIESIIDPNYKLWAAKKLVDIAHKLYNGEITLED